MLLFSRLARAGLAVLVATTASTAAAASSPSIPDPTETNDRSSLCAIEPNAIVSDACVSYAYLDALNRELHPKIRALTHGTEYFSHYRLNLFNKQCPFWSDDNGMCGNIACAVNTLDNEDDIPLVWRADELGKIEPVADAGMSGRIQVLERPDLKYPVPGLAQVAPDEDEFEEMDYCLPDDSGRAVKGDYVSLVDNPERFTGYSGPGAHQVWKAIYRENCFARQAASLAVGSGTGFGGQTSDFEPAGLGHLFQRDAHHQQFQNALGQGPQSIDGSASPFVQPDFEEDCLEKRVFYRVVSGMHASISTHLCWDYLNQMTGEWSPNVDCFVSRVGNHPDRISNLYFNYAVLLRATSKLKSFLQQAQFKSADPVQDAHAGALLADLADAIPNSSDIFDESIMFSSHDAAELKFEFRDRFRNISRIMDCVGCDKCRLWGKLQTAGYGTALKILFDFDSTKSAAELTLRRTDLVALINTLGRVSQSVYAVSQFDGLMRESAGQLDGLLRESASQFDGLLRESASQFDGLMRESASQYDGLMRESASKPAARLSEPATTSSNQVRSEKVEGSKEDPGRVADDDSDSDESIGEIFRTELRIVWLATKTVLFSLTQLPKTVYRAVVHESIRLGSFWLGYEPPPAWQYIQPPRLPVP